jgi:hypothetical protein
MYLITDQRDGESNILLGDMVHSPLTIRQLSSGIEIFQIMPPVEGWSHQSLQNAVDGAMRMDPNAFEAGADAYLNGTFVGSTEC